MLRFIDTDLVPFKAESCHSIYQRSSLEQALEAITPQIEQLRQFIEIANANCRFPSEHNLTHDESAAIFLYTMKWDNDIFYQSMKQDLRSKALSTSQPWLPYLNLFETAVQKLPSTRMNVWRGMNEETRQMLKNDDEELIWWNNASCSSSTNVIRDCLESNDRLCLIEAINARDISIYSQFPDQNEVILCSGTRLQVVSNAALHFREYDRPVRRTSSGRNNKQLPSLIVHLIVLIIALLLVTIVGKTLFTSESSSDKLDTHVDALGNSYEGEWFGGEKHGKGTMHFANGCVYTGDWIDDRATGEGIFTWPNGDRYEGQFQNGQRHGIGSYYFANGDTYTGGWAEDKKSGDGVSSLASGKYDGQFENDQMHGLGSFSFADGSTYVGPWVDNKQEGDGIFTWANGDRYEGEFKAGKLDGKGSYYFTNGNKFVGDWVDGERETDHGAFTWADISRKSKEDKPVDISSETDDQIETK